MLHGLAKGKRGKRKEEVEETTTSKGFALVSQIELTKDVIKRLERDLKRGAFKVLTPYTLAQAYNIRISVARKALREATKKGLLVLYSGGRTPIYVKPE